MKNFYAFILWWSCSLVVVGSLFGCVTQRPSDPSAKTERPSAKRDTSTKANRETVPQAYLEASLESLFSRVLSRGFKEVSKRNNISATRCGGAMRALTARGDTSARFLEKKLSAGTLADLFLEQCKGFLHLRCRPRGLESRFIGVVRTGVAIGVQTGSPTHLMQRRPSSIKLWPGRWKVVESASLQRALLFSTISPSN